jgi:hypothetical protein
LIDRAAAQAPAIAQRAAPARDASVSITEVRACGIDGIWRERFLEGEPMLIEAHLVADDALDGVHVTIALRELDGRAGGAQTLSGLDLEAGTTEVVRLHLPALPLREGGCHVDVRVVAHDSDRVLAERERALELAVFANDPGASGPTRLGGVWTLPNRGPDALPGATAQLSEGLP